MHPIKITGIVATANRMRRALSRPITPVERDRLAADVARFLGDVESLLRAHGTTVNHLPAPSQRAYRYLAQLDFRNVSVIEQSDAPELSRAPLPESFAFPGLRPFLDRLLDNVAQSVHSGQDRTAATLKVIRETAMRLDHSLDRDGVQPESLKPEARELVGWFRYFAREEAFASYVQAVRRASTIFDRLPAGKTHCRRPLLIHYRPLKGLYKWRAFADGTWVLLPTPMIRFDEAALDHLGRDILGHASSRAVVMDAMLDEPYQALAAELEAAGGTVEHSRGVTCDLGDVFERVNRQFFDGRMPRPRLAWSRTLTGRVFGHYDFVRDTVMISASLDRASVPGFVVEHVMHHELLHKKHGVRWHGRQRYSHTPEFRAEERAFARYEEADKVLKEIAQGRN